MDPQTIFVLSLQLIALFSIAGALLLYLLCKVRGSRTGDTEIRSGTILITSADTALGLQLTTHFANRGCRVFAGLKEPTESLSAKLLKGWIKTKENMETPIQGSILPLKLDVTKEDVLKDAVDAIGAHLNAGEKGIHAIINTSGCVFRGKIEAQNTQMWESMFKVNVLGSLRIARAFFGLLKPTRGRIIYLGNGNCERDLVAYSASRQAIEGCAEALREEFKPFGINVITIDSTGVPAESLYRTPIPYTAAEQIGHPMQYSAEVLTNNALSVIEQSIWDQVPNPRYALAIPNSKFHLNITCRSSSMGKHHQKRSFSSNPATNQRIESV